MKSKLLIFSGTANPALAVGICKYLQIELGQADICRFPDQEIDVKIESDVRGADVFIVQPTCTPVNEHLMELLISIDCAKRASANQITAVIPYYGYARKDRKDEGRVPITAKLVANLLVTAGAQRILTMDLHADQIQGFFDIPLDHLLARVVLVPYFLHLNIPNLVVVSPDIGSIRQARAYAKRLEADLAVIDKRRDSPRSVISGTLIGYVDGKNALIVDDMISTGNTMVEAYHCLKRNGCQDVYLCATHAVFAENAWKKMLECPAKQIVVTDTIPIPKDHGLPNLKVITIANYLGEAIRRIHESESISALFQQPLDLSSL